VETGSVNAAPSCTGWWDGVWRACCDAHDAAYQAGLPKFPADFELFRCVWDTGHPVNATIMFVGVLVFGLLFYPFFKKR